MSDIEATSRPISSVSTRIPSQAGIKAAFSRPVTAAGEDGAGSSNSEASDSSALEEFQLIEDVLITQLQEAVADPPMIPRVRFRRCKSEYKEELPEPADIFSEEPWDTDLESDDSTDAEEDDSSLPQLYTSICKKLKVVPISYFLRHIEDSAVSITQRAMIAAESNAIAKALKKVLMIESLNLDGNCIGNKGCGYLCETLEDNQVLRQLSMADNKLDDGCIKHINSMLSHNGTLKELSIAANMLTDNSAAVLADCMEDCKLKMLDLSRNEFGERGGVILGPALSTNVYLDTLDLSWNQIRGAGAISIAKGLKENVHLSVCNLSWNGFSELGGFAIADALLVNTNLKEIDISSNRLTYNVAVRIAKALATNELLEVLKMANNPISTNGCLVLVEAVYKSSTSTVRYLDLYENPVEYEFLRVARDLAAKKPGFEIYHGAILRAGNTEHDIGKPAIDIVRLSQRPAMILKGELTVNQPEKLMKCLTKYKIKSKCTAEQLVKCLMEIDNTLFNKELVKAVDKLNTDEDGNIILSDIF